MQKWMRNLQLELAFFIRRSNAIVILKLTQKFLFTTALILNTFLLGSLLVLRNNVIGSEYAKSLWEYNSEQLHELQLKEILIGELFYRNEKKCAGLYRTWRWRSENDGKLYISPDGYSDGNFSFNNTLSDRLPVNRDIWDTRPPMCDRLSREVDQLALPKASVVIPYHNEPLSTLTRTVHSVITRGPKELIHEVLLVDDGSPLESKWNREPLEKATFSLSYDLGVEVKLIRAVQREGSTKVRLIGAAYATGDVISYLDSHVECNQNWLVPVLNHIRLYPNAVVMSMLDSITPYEFGLKRTFTGYHGGFKWSLDFYWKRLPEYRDKIRHLESDPLPSPIMPAGAFALSKDFYERLGMLDPDMKIWGVDDVEFSFRVWRCGGRVEILPCSRVAHIFRKGQPYSFGDSSRAKVVFHNAIRSAELMGDQKKFFYGQADHYEVPVNVTSIRRRIHLQNGLQCKSFDWFMENIIPEMEVPPDGAIHWEQMRSDSNPENCMTTVDGSNNIELSKCVDLSPKQWFYFDTMGQVKVKDKCVGVRNNSTTVLVGECFSKEFHSTWKFDHKGSRNIILDSTTLPDRCLTVDGYSVVLDTCEQRALQKWEFDYHFDWSKQLAYS